MQSIFYENQYNRTTIFLKKANQKSNGIILRVRNDIMIEELIQSNFDAKIKKGNSIVDFFAEWCGPCKIMDPIFEKLDKEFPNINFFKVNVDNNQNPASTYDVRSIPTVIFVKDGKEIDRFLGLMREDDFKVKIKEVFK
ncbi:MAG: thioredoxin [Nanoarchaeota archaeon]|nr:thioredoxin [Nanoarchaeota archaeon]